jgi:hypothetical protein
MAKTTSTYKKETWTEDEILNSKVQLLSHNLRYTAGLLKDWFINPKPVNARDAQKNLGLIITRAQEMQGLITKDMEGRYENPAHS